MGVGADDALTVNPRVRLLADRHPLSVWGKGWIYRFHYHGMVRGDEKALVPRPHLRTAAALYDQTWLSDPAGAAGYVVDSGRRTRS